MPFLPFFAIFLFFIFKIFCHICQINLTFKFVLMKRLDRKQTVMICQNGKAGLNCIDENNYNYINIFLKISYFYAKLNFFWRLRLPILAIIGNFYSIPIPQLIATL